MKKVSMLILASASVAANAVVYTDALNDVNMPGGYFANQDIKTVSVSNDATYLYISIELNDNIANPSTNWGKYCVMFDTTAGGDTASNGWGRSIGMTSGMDYWIGSWADQSPTSFRQLWSYSGSWNNMNQDAVTISGNTTSMKVALADMGLTMGSIFCFDVMSTGGGGNDSAWDLLSKSVVNDSNNDNQTGWTEYTTTGANCPQYQVVPEPASITAMLLGAGALIRRRKK